MRRLPLYVLACVLLLAPRLRAVEPLWTDDNIPPAVLASLERAQDLALDLRYDDALALLKTTIPLAPRHPLCAIFLQATRLSRIQEGVKYGFKDIPPEYFAEADRLVAQLQAQCAAYPDSPYPHLYLGAACGMRGLARLYVGDYVTSYFDGKNGDAELKRAVALDPQLYNAYMGLGQFEYYCGSMNGVVQLLLDLRGNPDKGLAMLGLCGAKGTYASWPCRAYSVRLLTDELHEYARVEPELLALQARYPDNYDFSHALFQSMDAGVAGPALRLAARDWLARAPGLRLPKRAGLDLDALRFSLAKAEARAGDWKGAEADAGPLLKRPGPWSARARALLAGGPKP